MHVFQFFHESFINVSLIIQLTCYCVFRWAKSRINHIRLQHSRYTADDTLQGLQGILSDIFGGGRSEGERAEAT